jgi:hypothetical protein
MPDPIRTRDTAPHRPPPPFNRTTTRTRRGTPTTDGRDSITSPALQYHVTPPSSRHPAIHDGPPLHQRRGGRRQGNPTTQRSTERHSPSHHTPGNERRTTRVAVLTSTALGRTGARATHTGSGRPAQHTPPPFHTPRHKGWTPSTHPLPHCSCSRSHNQRTIIINVDQQSMFND